MVILIGCQKDFDNEEVVISDPYVQTRDSVVHVGGYPADTLNLYKEIIAKGVAKAELNAAFRSFLLQEAKLQVGQENVVLYGLVRDRVITNGKTFSQMIADGAAIAGVNRSASFFREDVLRAIPNLAITVYTGPNDTPISEWSSMSLLKVAFMTEEAQGPDLVAVRAFAPLQSVSQSYWFNNQDDPQEPLLVVEDNTAFLSVKLSNLRITNTNQTIFQYLVLDQCMELQEEIEEEAANLDLIYPDIFIGETFFLNPDYEVALISLYALYEKYNELCGMDQGDSDPLSGDSCDRDSRENREEVFKIQIDNYYLRRFCKWTRSQCNIEAKQSFAVYTGANMILNSPPIKFINGDRSKMKQDKIFNCNLPMYKWEYLQGNHGDPYSITFIGKHPRAGQKNTYSFSFPPKITFKILGQEVTFDGLLKVNSEYSKTDEILGGDLIYYCDPANGEGTKYITGKMNFWIKEQEN